MSIFICCLLAWILSGVIACFLCKFYFKEGGLSFTLKKDYGFILFVILFGCISLISMFELIYKNENCKNKIKEYVFGKIQK